MNINRPINRIAAHPSPLSQTPPDDYMKQSSILHASFPSSNIPLVGISPDSEIIYEINLSVPKEVSNEYVKWLKTFTKEQCELIPGFTDCKVFSQPKPAGLHWLSEEGDLKCYFTVQYHVKNQEYLKDYFKQDQSRLARAEIDKFKYTVISRRLLRQLFTTYVTEEGSQN